MIKERDMKKRERRTYTAEFKLQMVQLFLNGKPKTDIVREYELTPSSFDKWISQHQNSGSFKESDNKTEDQLRLEKLLKENQQLKMENDILKQAALILGRK